jgi:antitoxin VapB
MVLIKDKEADQLIRRLAERAGETMTEAVKKAVAERLSRLPLSENEIAERKRRIARLMAEADAMPTVDHRTADEIIGYNDQGHFD